MNIYSRIEEYLKEKGMSKRKLAEIAQIPYSSLISAFNRKSESFSMSYIQRIAGVLEVSVEDLLGRKAYIDDVLPIGEVYHIEMLPDEKRAYDKYLELTESGKEFVLDMVDYAYKRYKADMWEVRHIDKNGIVFSSVRTRANNDSDFD